METQHQQQHNNQYQQQQQAFFNNITSQSNNNNIINPTSYLYTSSLSTSSNWSSGFESQADESFDLPSCDDLQNNGIYKNTTNYGSSDSQMMVEVSSSTSSTTTNNDHVFNNAEDLPIVNGDENDSMYVK